MISNRALEAMAEEQVIAYIKSGGANAPARKPVIRDTRACPDCGRPQHYTGHENGWCHDALIDTWDCADPARTRAWATAETRCESCAAVTDLTCQRCGRPFCRNCLSVHRRGLPGAH